MKITMQVIDRLRHDPARGKKHVVWDDELKGFGVRVWPTGKKTFVLFYRTRGGRQRFMSLGRYGVLTLHQARDRARSVLVEVLDGKDPLTERRNASSSETVEQLARVYLERHAKAYKRSWKRDKDWIEAHIIPKLGKLRVIDLTEEDVARLHRELGITQGKKSLANKILNTIAAMYNLAPRWKIPTNPKHPNPAKHVERFPENHRNRWVTEEELPRLAAAIEAEENVFARAAIWLYLMLGMRHSELRTIRWGDVDLVRGWLTQLNTKSGEPLRLPLPPAAVKIFEALPRFASCEYVFAGRDADKPMHSLQPAWVRIRARAKLDDVRIHDLRHTLASWMVNSGKSLEIIGGTLNHATRQMTERYAHVAKAPIARALDEHAQRLLEVAKVKPLDAHDSPREVLDAEVVEP